MNRTKVHFHKDYQQLLAQVVDKMQQQSIASADLKNNYIKTQLMWNTPLKINSKSPRLNYTPQPSSQKNPKPSPEEDNSHVLPYNFSQDQPNKTYYVFGESSPAKSLQMGKTFVNLGNNRYLINKEPGINLLNKTGEFSLQNMDHVQTTTFNVNNLTFPVLGSTSSRGRKTLFPVHPLPSQINSSPRNNASKAFRFSYSKKRDPYHKSDSLEINNRQRNKTKKNNQLSQQNPNSQEIQRKDTKLSLTMNEIEKRLKIQTNDYLKQVAFSNQYEQKLLEMERNIVHKRRIEKLKIDKMKKDAIEKDKIQAWREEGTTFSPTNELYDVEDHIKSKPGF